MPSVSLIRGKHSIKVGADIRDIRANALGGSFLWGSGQFAIQQQLHQPLPGFGDGTGNAMASLLLGYPTGGTVQYVPQLAYRWGYYGFYINDDFKVTNRLTLNLGLRYDIEGVPDRALQPMNAGFGFNQASPLASAVRNANAADCPACANLHGGLLFVDQNNREPFSNDLNNWQPRIGAAYRLASRPCCAAATESSICPKPLTADRPDLLPTRRSSRLRRAASKRSSRSTRSVTRIPRLHRSDGCQPGSLDLPRAATSIFGNRTRKIASCPFVLLRYAAPVAREHRDRCVLCGQPHPRD